MIVIAVLGALAAIFTIVCCAVGFMPAGTLGSFEPGMRGEARRFFQSPEIVVDAYRRGVRRTPGMRVVEEGPNEMLVDLRPTARILDGNFGIVFRLCFAPDGSGTVVTTQGRDKVPWSLSNHHAAFRHAETALRMNAKRHGIEEVL